MICNERNSGVRVLVLSSDPWINRLHGASILSFWCELHKYVKTEVYIAFEQYGKTYSFPPCNIVRTLTVKNLPLVDFISLSIRFLDTLIRIKPSIVICDPATFLPSTIYKLLFRDRVRLVLLILSRPVLTSSIRGKLSVVVFKLSLTLARYFAEKITAISPFEAENYARLGRLPRKKLIVLPSPVDPIFIKTKCEELDKKGLRKNIGLEKFLDKIIILYYGVINKERGIIDLVSTFFKIKADNVILLIIGDGPDRKLLEGYVKSSDNVLVLPPIPYKNIPKLLCAIDIGILPLPNVKDWRYQTPTKLVEMLTIGLPVITTNLPGVKWVLREYNCKFLIEKLDEKSLSEAIYSILRMKDSVVCKRSFDYSSSSIAKRFLVEIFNTLRETK